MGCIEMGSVYKIYTVFILKNLVYLTKPEQDNSGARPISSDKTYVFSNDLGSVDRLRERAGQLV